jgi:uncharacterized protein YcfJ
MLTLTGCVTSQEKRPTDTTQTSEQAEHSDRTEQSDQTRTRAEGTAAGALLGGLIGGILGGDAGGAFIGAAIGGATGFLIGNEIAKRKQQYASEEAFLDSEIKIAKEFNNTATQYNQQLKQQIAELDNISRVLLARYEAGEASIEDLKAKRAEIEDKIKATIKVSKELQKEYDVKVAVYKEQKNKRDSNDSYLVSLTKEIKQLEKNISALKSGAEQLAQIDDRLEV